MRSPTRTAGLAGVRRALAAALLVATAGLAGVAAGAPPSDPSGDPSRDPSRDPSGDPPACRYDHLPAADTGYHEWNRTVLDTIYALDADYTPPDLVPVSQAGFAGDTRVRALLIDDLRALREAAEAAGVPLEVQSAYRSHAYQARTFDYWVAQQGRDEALRTSARAGHSEHQLGTTLDFRSRGGPPAWDLPDWAATPAGAWMAANAWRFGFVMSYPAGAEPESCYAYEPWHYRYLGREAAAAVHASGVPPRVWLWRQGAAAGGAAGNAAGDAAPGSDHGSR